MRRLPLTGRVFGRLTVVGTAPRTYQTMWACRCECGKELLVSGTNLTTGHTSSCGCLREELRKTYAAKRDFTGLKNLRAQASTAKAGAHVPSDSVWYKRAAGIYYSARRRGIRMGFNSPASLALYVESIAPTHCPVFKKRFEEGGKGFHPWSPSIDKCDPSKGYVRGNIQVISVFANAMKRNATPRELRQFAEWVIQGQSCQPPSNK